MLPAEGAPTPRAQATAVSGGGHFLVWGGASRVERSGIPVSVLGDGAIYDPSSNTWQPMATVGAPSARSNAKAVWTGTKFVLWAGRAPGDTADNNDGFIFDPERNEWTEMNPDMRPMLGSFKAYVMADGNLFFAHADLRPNAIFEVEANRWKPLDLQGRVSYMNEIVLWTGSRLIVWGGAEMVLGGNDFEPYKFRNEGAIFTPRL